MALGSYTLQRQMATSKPRDHMARVACSDEVWTEFKRLPQTDGWQPVNEYLGALVVTVPIVCAVGGFWLLRSGLGKRDEKDN